MNKWDFIKRVSEKSGKPQTELNKVITAITEVITEQVRDNGEDVTLLGFGTFKQRKTEAKTCRSPFDGKTITTKPSRTIQFKPSPSIKVEDK